MYEGEATKRLRQIWVVDIAWPTSDLQMMGEARESKAGGPGTMRDIRSLDDEARPNEGGERPSRRSYTSRIQIWWRSEAGLDQYSVDECLKVRCRGLSQAKGTVWLSSHWRTRLGWRSDTDCSFFKPGRLSYFWRP